MIRGNFASRKVSEHVTGGLLATMKSKSFWVACVAVLLAATATAIAQQKSETPSAGAPPRARLITQPQYVNTLRAIFGQNVKFPAQLAPLNRTGGLVGIGSSSAIVTGGTFDRFDSAARQVAKEVFDPAHREYLMPCRPKSETQPDDACARKFISLVSPPLFRQALSDSDLKDYTEIAHMATVSLGNFYAGMGATLAGMLVSPDFLYVVPETEVVRGQTQLTARSKAVRLSLLLWNAYPDTELLNAAENGSLNTDKGLAKQVERMLASPRVADGVRNFFDDMLIFENFETLAKDPKIYPVFTTQVTSDAKEQTLRTIVAHLVNENGDYRDLFTTRKTFLTNDLAAVYGVAIDDPDRWVPYEFPKSGARGGLLTQVSFLALYSHPGRSSPTRRGRAIREIFLCQKVPDPPPNVDFSALERPDPTLKTARARLTAHSQNPVCAGCHKITDPIGLALENFDGAGAYRVEENGAAIDAGGQLNAANFSNAMGLEQALHDNPSTPTCLVERMASYALGRPVKADDQDLLKSVNDRFASSGYRMKELLRVIAIDKSFYAVPAGDSRPTVEKADVQSPSQRRKS